MRQDEATVVAEGQIDQGIDTAKNSDKESDQQPLVIGKRAQPGTQGSGPAQEQPEQGIDRAEDRVHQPQAASDARILFCLFLFFGIESGH